MTTVTHHQTTPSSERPMNAVPVSALSAMGSATLPKFVISPRLRAILPSTPSVTAASAKTTHAQKRHHGSLPPSWKSSTA
jgi:hypothetical protein